MVIVILLCIAVICSFVLGNHLRKAQQDFSAGRKIVSLTPKPIPKITINDFFNVQFIYLTNNGSLPPPDHRESTLIISGSSKGLITATQEVRDYNKVLEKKNFNITSDQFEDIINLALNLKSSLVSAEGCPGSSTQSVKVLKKEETLLAISADSCGNNPTYQSLSGFSSKINKILYFFDLIDSLEKFPNLSADDVAKILKVDWVEKSEPFYVVKEAKGDNIAEFFKSAELRIPREIDKGGLLILDLKDDLGILEKDVLNKYPKAVGELINVTNPTSAPPYDWMVEKPWGKISFQIPRDGTKRVIAVFIDSID